MALSESRRAINRHLFRDHGRTSASGSTVDRKVEHEWLHSKGMDGYAGLPLHRHDDWDDVLNFSKYENGAK
jgi:hypothetical protein